MINRNEISLDFIKKEPLTGSDTGMRFVLKKASDELLSAVIWPEPYSLEATDDALKTEESFPLSSDGLTEAVEWLNDQHKNRSQIWDSVNGKPLASIM